MRVSAIYFGLGEELAEAMETGIRHIVMNSITTNPPFGGEFRTPDIVFKDIEEDGHHSVLATFVVPEFRGDDHVCDHLIASNVSTEHYRPLMAGGPIGEA